MQDKGKRRIRVSCEVNFAGCEIEDAYYDLPGNWDAMSAKERDDYLTELAVNELSLYAGSGASVVDENGEDAS